MALVGIDDEAKRRQWFALRSRLFLNITYPSVERQSLRPAKWYLLLSEGDEAIYEECVGLNESWVEPIFMRADETISDQCRSVLQKEFSGSGSLLISKADNDDAIHREFFETVLAAAERANINGDFFVLCRYGCRWDGESLQAVDYPNNPFISLYLPAWKNGKVNLFTIEHTKIQERRHIFVPDRPDVALWLQSLHGANASNRFQRNSPVAPTSFEVLQDAFGIGPRARDVILEHRAIWQIESQARDG